MRDYLTFKPTRMSLTCKQPKAAGFLLPEVLPYLEIYTEVPKDPWGNSYVFTIPGSHGEFDIVSYAKDGVSGGTGWAEDITNWNQ